MFIESLKIQNFKSLQNIHLQGIPTLAVFVGRNGVGKSTLFRVFAFLRNCLQDNLRVALNKEGGIKGFSEVVSRGHENERILIEIQFRMRILERNRLVTYRLEFGIKDKRPVIFRETLSYKRGSYGSPYQYLNFSCGKGRVVTNEKDFDEPTKELERGEQELDAPDILAIKGLGLFGQQFKAASAFRQLIENWHISDFHIGDARGKIEDQDARHLSASGNNLPAVARYLNEDHPEIFQQILQKMRSRVPGIAEVKVLSTEDGGLLLSYRDGAFIEPFIDRNVSDGTIKMFAYLVLLEDPQPFKVLCVEEPENQLYPELMTVLAEEFMQYTQRGGQVFVSSHSPEFLDAIPLENIYWLEKENGATRILRAFDYVMLKNLHKEGDLPGVLWQQGFFDTKRLG